LTILYYQSISQQGNWRIKAREIEHISLRAQVKAVEVLSLK
jgi:hypothetical protein